MDYKTKPAIPMTPAVFHILLSLADAERHGYGIMKEVHERTGNAFRLGPGTLYRSIQRMSDAGYIEARDEAPEDDRKRFYRITDAGREAASREAKRLLDLVRQSEAKKIITGVELTLS